MTDAKYVLFYFWGPCTTPAPPVKSSFTLIIQSSPMLVNLNKKMNFSKIMLTAILRWLGPWMGFWLGDGGFLALVKVALGPGWGSGWVMVGF
jgi:hypothetical protein